MRDEEVLDVFGTTISCYTRAEAIADGFLIDVSATAQKAGFKIPVAVTNSVWDDFIQWSNVDNGKQGYQDQSGRLWDVLYMLYIAILKTSNAACVFYKLLVIPRDGRSKKPKTIRLKAVIGGGDKGEAVITIMLPHED